MMEQTKFYVVIDCGTTNSRAYVVDEAGNLYGIAKETVGVKDVSTSGDKKILFDGLRRIVPKAIEESGQSIDNIECVISSGMITSEIGLYEIPHEDAPCTIEDMAESVVVCDSAILPGKPLYLVRGIRNPVKENGNPFKSVGTLDFMRGEEVQVAGIVSENLLDLPGVVVILSSHTKFIPLSENAEILGSLTTMSGQLYSVIKNNTFLSKSLEADPNEKMPDDYFDTKIVDWACDWDTRIGLNRASMFLRFLDVLLDTKWYERTLFLETLIAAEDMRSVRQLQEMFPEKYTQYLLVGDYRRCKLYAYLLQKMFNGLKISVISDSDRIDQLTINGAINIAKRASLLK